jgi:dienelactone hydrolase
MKKRGQVWMEINMYALKLLSTHPDIDASRIYHMGWSRGGNAVTGAMWPSYRKQILNPTDSEESKWFGEPVKWAGSIALYPGCNLRYLNGASKISAPVLYLLGAKDEMTPAQPCVEEAQKLAAAGNPVTYKVYPGAHHVFDRLNQPWRQYKEGNFAACALDVVMPTGPKDVGHWGPGYNRATGKTIETPEEFQELAKACRQTSYISVESNTKAREQSVQDVLNFVKYTK